MYSPLTPIPYIRHANAPPNLNSQNTKATSQNLPILINIITSHRPTSRYKRVIDECIGDFASIQNRSVIVNVCFQYFVHRENLAAERHRVSYFLLYFPSSSRLINCSAVDLKPSSPVTS